MNKTVKISLNILIFALIVGFGYYVIHSIKLERTILTDMENVELAFISPYKKTNSFDVDSEILCFETGVFQDWILVVLADKISVFEHSGKHLYDFWSKVDEGVRDITVEDVTIYLLYPTKIVSYTLKGDRMKEWEACSENSDYCAITVTKESIFVTDAENKNIVQYDKQGKLVRFIKSPNGFIIPSYTFDIITINDTIYCSNSGRHSIESYTLDGEFIASFGKAGMQAGAFAGCCNPVYLAKTSNGNILTSEKGSPRISSYGRDGKFRTILFDADMLGGGTAACEMQVSGENIYIANKNTISVYSFDSTISEESCNMPCEGCPMRRECKK